MNDRYENPILSGTNSDPSLCRVGEDYYLVTASLGYWPSVPVYHSRDLVSWRMIGYCLHRPGQVHLKLTKIKLGTWAATIRHHEGRFYVTTTLMGGPSGERNLIVSATDPAGPWSDPVWIDQKGIDPSLFWDEDGICYLCTSLRLSGRPRNDIAVSAINPDTGERLSEVKPVWSGIGELCPEGPHLYKINGWYYLFIAEGGTYGGHMENVARAESIWGPYESCPGNPILTHRHDHAMPIQFAGHGDIVQIQDGSWWMVHLGVRCSGYQRQHLGRETFLVPIGWDDHGWPVVNGGKGTTDEEGEAPALPLCRWPQESLKDDFDAPIMALCWNHIGDARPEAYSLSERPGWLRLKGSPLSLDDTDGPTFVGRRQQHFSMQMTALLEFEPARENEEAGVTVFMDSIAHYDLGVALREGHRMVFVRLRLDRLIVEIAAAPLAPGPVEMRISGVKDHYAFSFRQHGEIWQELGEAPTRYVCAEVADTFTGVFLGLYATGYGQACHAVADYDWVDYEPLLECGGNG